MSDSSKEILDIHIPTPALYIRGIDKGANNEDLLSRQLIHDLLKAGGILSSTFSQERLKVGLR